MIEWIESLPPWVWITLVVHGVVLGTVAYLILLERKVASWVQDRLGPNRVGFDFGLPFLGFLKGMNGLGQPLADGLKFILKEDYAAKGVDKVLFTVAPVMMIIVVIISIAVIPWGGSVQRTATIPAGQTAADVVPMGSTIVAQTSSSVTYTFDFQIARVNIGVLFIIAALSLAVYGVVIGGWASNNKYSFLGGLRATANMISYEIPLGLMILTIVVMFGTLDLTAIVDKQIHSWGGVIPAWNVFMHPLAFVLFLVCIHAEANRAPFDTAEAEQELVGGYHTEYSSMRFALFFLAEYAGMITTSALCVALFFGGWDFFGLRGPVENPSLTDSIVIAILRSIVFFAKTIAILFIFMWTRWSLPRFRFDQILMLAWRALIPISLAMLIATALIVYWWGPRDPKLYVPGGMAFAMLAMNVVIAVATALVSFVIPAAPATNRKMPVTGSRFSPMLSAEPATA